MMKPAEELKRRTPYETKNMFLQRQISHLVKERDTLKEALRLACEDNHNIPSVNECRLGTDCGEDCTIHCKVPYFMEQAKKPGNISR
jgi:hypothetical protein